MNYADRETSFKAHENLPKNHIATTHSFREKCKEKSEISVSDASKISFSGNKQNCKTDGKKNIMLSFFVFVFIVFFFKKSKKYSSSSREKLSCIFMLLLFLWDTMLDNSHLSAVLRSNECFHMWWPFLAPS